MMDGAKKKRKKNRSVNSETEDLEDRISRLPDSLISHILSFLKMKDVMKTSLLARRWRSLWTMVPVLDFDCWWTDDFSIRVLISHSFKRYTGGKIRKFHAHADNDVKGRDIDTWLNFTTKHGVEELDIRGYNYYRIPRFLDYGSLTVLKLEYCALDLGASDCFPSLRKLHLYDVDFTDLDTSGCFVLEELIMEKCRNCRNIFAPNEKLRYLKDKSLGSNNGLTIYAPNLLSIEFNECLRQFYNLKDISSVKKAIIDFSPYMLIFSTGALFHTEPEDKVMLDLIKNLGHVKTLKLSKYSIQTLACRLEDILRMPLLSASSLEVETRLGKSEITLIAALLSRSHCLETFSIRIKTMDVFEYDVIPHLIAEIANWEFLEFTLGELQLKTVTIHNFLESLPNELCPTTAASLDIGKFMENLEEMKLVRALLKGCKMLDKLIIRTAKLSSWSLKYSELLRRLTKEMLVLPRASARAELHFSHMA